MDGNIVGNMSFIVAFIEGLASFFSACVIPLLPIYVGYLTGGMQEKEVSKKRTILFTLCFIFGIFVALFLLNLSFTWISSFFQDASVWFMRIGGILIILLGCMQLGLLKISLFERTFHLQNRIQGKKMNPVLAFVMGFTFSFSWTPCIGPALASILVMAQTMGGALTSMLLVFVYACGFALPFLCISFGARYVTFFFQKHANALAVITKIGALLLILMGSFMFFGKLSILGGGTIPSQDTSSVDEGVNQDTNTIDFTLHDQNNQSITLSDYEGKLVYLNFWATWCPNCIGEFEDLHLLQKEYKEKGVEVLTVVYPGVGGELDEDGIKAFLKEKDITLPVLFDLDGAVFGKYGIRSFPTLYLIDKNQSIYGYLSGAIPYDVMKEIIDKALEGIPANEQ